MHFKLILVFVDDNKTDDVLKAARDVGATGATIINNARGEGIEQKKTFLGLNLETQRDVLPVSYTHLTLPTNREV